MVNPQTTIRAAIAFVLFLGGSGCFSEGDMDLAEVSSKLTEDWREFQYQSAQSGGLLVEWDVDATVFSDEDAVQMTSEERESSAIHLEVTDNGYDPGFHPMTLTTCTNGNCVTTKSKGDCASIGFYNGEVKVDGNQTVGCLDI